MIILDIYREDNMAIESIDSIPIPPLEKPVREKAPEPPGQEEPPPTPPEEPELEVDLFA